VFLLKKTAIVQLLLTKFESTKITKKGQPILGQDNEFKIDKYYEKDKTENNLSEFPEFISILH
jgi:hypothetical protein